MVMKSVYLQLNENKNKAYSQQWDEIGYACDSLYAANK